MIRSRTTLVFWVSLILVGCRSSPSKPQSGIWTGETDFGTFSFTVDSSGTHILHFDYILHTCSATNQPGGRTFEGEITFSPPIEIQAGNFSFFLSGPPGINFQGEFDEKGNQATGTWKAGQCEGIWEITISD